MTVTAVHEQEEDPMNLLTSTTRSGRSYEPNTSTPTGTHHYTHFSILDYTPDALTHLAIVQDRSSRVNPNPNPTQTLIFCLQSISEAPVMYFVWS